MLDHSDPHSLVSKPFWRLLGTWGGSIRYSTSEWRNSSGVLASTGRPLALHLWLSHSSTSWLLSHLAVTAEAYCDLFCLILVRYQPRSLTKVGSSWLWAMMLTPPDLYCVLHQLPNKAGLSVPWFLPSWQREILARIKGTPSTYLPLRTRGCLWVTSISCPASLSVFREPSLLCSEEAARWPHPKELVKITAIVIFSASTKLAFPCDPAGKDLPAMWETWVRPLGWEDLPGEGKGYPLHYSGLENSMDIAKSWTYWVTFTFTFH